VDPDVAPLGLGACVIEDGRRRRARMADVAQFDQEVADVVLPDVEQVQAASHHRSSRAAAPNDGSGVHGIMHGRSRLGVVAPRSPVGRDRLPCSVLTDSASMPDRHLGGMFAEWAR
jgi:hypothetical protein